MVVRFVWLEVVGGIWLCRCLGISGRGLGDRVFFVVWDFRLLIGGECGIFEFIGFEEDFGRGCGGRVSCGLFLRRLGFSIYWTECGVGRELYFGAVLILIYCVILSSLLCFLEFRFLNT